MAPLPLPLQKTPDHVIDQLKAAIAADDIDAFRELLSGPETHLNELAAVTREALVHDNARAVSELLRRCKFMHYWDAEVTIAAHAKQYLATLLEHGWALNMQGHLLPSVLRHAVTDREMVFWLLERGADLNKSAHIDITVITPLSFAVRDAAPDLLQELLDYGGDVQKGEVLQYALDRQSDILTVLGMLLDRGAPLDAVMYEEHPGSMQLYFFRERHTPLCKAAMIGNTEAVRFLLERGADPSVQNFKGRTALECAERNGHKKIVEILAQVASYERCRETWTLAEDTTSHRTPQSPGQD